MQIIYLIVNMSQSLSGMRDRDSMKYQNNVKYFCMMRDLFEHMSVEIVGKFEKWDTYMISIQNSNIREIFNKSGMDYDEFENLIQDIAQQLFEKGKYYLNIVVTRDTKGVLTEINLYTKMPENIEKNQEKYKFKIKNNINILNDAKRRILLYKISKMNEYQIENYNSAYEMTYFSERHKQDQYKFIKITKNVYINGDTPEEITTYYHNYRVIKTRTWQVKLALDIIKKLNKVLEGIFFEKDIIKYEGITLEELDEYLKELKKDEISMLSLSNKIMRVEKI